MQSMTTDSPSQSPTAESGENNLQPFFVLHKAVPKKGDNKVSGSGKTRSRLDLSVASLKPTEKSEEANQFQEDDYDQLRVEAFHVVWSKIETTIKEVLRNININVFDVINQWVHESFSSIRSTGIHCSSHSYTPVTSITCKQIFTGLMFTRNVDFVDDLLTFKELAMHLRSHGCHVVTLSSLDFSAKNGIGVCIRSLLRQLIMVTPDTADIAILASWYSEPQHCDSPLVLMIDDMERCNGSVLSELILMLSEWVVKIPIILIMGVATTVDAPRKLLPSTALQYLSACEFTLGSPAERMDAIVEAVLLKLSSGFDIGHDVAVFLRNYFLKQDGTITAFIRALKIACAKHFSMEPLSFLCKDFLNEDSQSFWSEESVLLPEPYLKYAFDLPSLKSRGKFSDMNVEDLASGLSAMRRLRKEWSSVVLCLYEVGKFHRLQFFDIFCEALDPALYDLRASSKHQSGEVLQTTPAKDSLNDGGYSGKKEGFIFQAICKLRDLPVARLSQVLQICKKHTEEIPEIRGRFEKLQSMLKVEAETEILKRNKTSTSKRPTARGHLNLEKDTQRPNEKVVGDTEILKQNKTSTSKRPTARGHLNMEKDTRRLNEKVVTLMHSIVRDYLKPIECVPFHEIFCFKNVEILQSSLIGDPRRMIQVDLQKPHVHLHCNCCSKSGNALLPFMNDSSIIYKLAQEHGDLINLHDWFQSYKSIVLRPTPKGKGKSQQSVSKKRKSTEQTQVLSVASVQAQFCKAVTDLQITGLLRMPSKRRPDFVQRIAFGL